MSGTVDAEDYTTVLEGGQMYYLHFGYDKYATVDNGEDKFTINSIKIELNKDDFLEDTEVVTNSNGEIFMNLSNGTYQITEIEAPDGYTLDSTPITYEFVTGQDNTITVKNNPQTDLIVHHYIKNTTTSVADDETQKGDIGTEYTTAPKIDLEKYQLVKNEDGTYQIPDNASGTFTEDTQVVTYYYELKPSELIVHHYVDGTEDSVAPDETYEGTEGESYTTNAATYPTLDEKYELVESKLPDNATGTYTDTVTEVTYYYKARQHEITTEVDGGNGTITGEEETPYETVLHGEDSVKDIICTPDTGYQIKSITVNGEEIEFTANNDGTYTLDKFISMTEDKHIIVVFENKDSNVIITKLDKDTQKPLEGVEFNITDEDGYIVKDIYGNTMMNLATDENGNIKVTLADGKYKLAETKKLTGYVKADIQEFEVKTVTETVLNSTWEIKYPPKIVYSVSDDNGIICIEQNGYYIFKVDKSGNTLWSTGIPFPDGSSNKKVLVTTSKNIIAIDEMGTFGVIDSTDGSLKQGEFSFGYGYSDSTAFDEDVVVSSSNGSISRYSPNSEKDTEIWVNSDKNYSYTSICTVEDGVVAVSSEGQVVKYSSDGKFVWENTEKIYDFVDVCTLSDGVVAVSSSGQIVKYDTDGNIAWENTDLTYEYSCVALTSDGIIAGGKSGKIVKYSLDGSILWDLEVMQNLKYNSDITAISVLDDEFYVASPSIDGCLMKLTEKEQVSQEKSITNLTIENEYKEYKITTDVEEVNGVKGGSISGEDETPYETVPHEEDSTKDIVCTPDSGYKISSITVNGTAIEFTANDDGTYTLDKFTSMTEDKHIVVKYEKKDTSIIVKHQTEDGTDLVEPETVTGKIGDSYETEPKDFDEYELKTTPDNSTGTMTEEQIEVIYVYSKVKGSIKVTKVDNSNTTKVLSGATFKLEKLDANGNVDDTFTAVEKTTTDTGIVEFSDLTVGTYTITETKAPEGYSLNKESTEVSVTKANKDVNVTIKDKEKLELPETGMKDYTIILVCIGTALILTTSGVMIYNKNKK